MSLVICTYLVKDGHIYSVYMFLHASINIGYLIHDVWQGCRPSVYCGPSLYLTYSMPITVVCE